MNNDLTPKDIVAWCRAQAKKFNDIADAVEGAFHSNGTEAMRELPLAPAAPQDEDKILSIVTSVLLNKSKRFSELETLTGATRKQLKKLLTPERGFERGPQGWITFKENKS